MPAPEYGTSVFVNCPFDSGYKPIFESILFTVADCGFQPRCALEIEDSSQIRMEKIFEIIAGCRYGIHDISSTDLDAATQLPRYNMPLELGIFLGAKRFGHDEQNEKVGLILDRAPYRYQTFMSDIAGQDIRNHEDDPKRAISIVRNWLRNASRRTDIPGGRVIAERYERFRAQLPSLSSELRLTEDELTFNDYTWVVAVWLTRNA